MDSRSLPASAYSGYYTAELVTPDDEAEASPLASGSGFATFTVTPGGTLTFAGKLPDGSAYAIPAFIDEQGSAWIFKFMYGYVGMLSGDIALSLGTGPSYNDSGVAGTLMWRKPGMTPPVDPEALDLPYLNGIDRDFDVRGARYLKPNLPLLTGPYVMNANGSPPVLNLSASGGGLIDTATATGTLSTQHVMTPNNSMSYLITAGKITFNAVTGTFSGTASSPYYDPDTDELVATYKPTFYGVVTRADPASLAGYGAGFFAHRVIYPIYFYDEEDNALFLWQKFSALLSGKVEIRP